MLEQETPIVIVASAIVLRKYGTNRFGDFFRRLARRQDAFDDVIEGSVENLMYSGNLEEGFAHYKGFHLGRRNVKNHDGRSSAQGAKDFSQSVHARTDFTTPRASEITGFHRS
jgi:hypothetical protein